LKREFRVAMSSLDPAAIGTASRVSMPPYSNPDIDSIEGVARASLETDDG